MDSRSGAVLPQKGLSANALSGSARRFVDGPSGPDLVGRGELFSNLRLIGLDVGQLFVVRAGTSRPWQVNTRYPRIPLHRRTPVQVLSFSRGVKKKVVQNRREPLETSANSRGILCDFEVRRALLQGAPRGFGLAPKQAGSSLLIGRNSTSPRANPTLWNTCGKLGASGQGRWNCFEKSGS